MDPRIDPRAGRQYEYFEPKTEVIPGGDKETLVIYLPGFDKSELRLQLTPNRLFKLSGERHVSDNKWSRVEKQYPAAANTNLSRVVAKFDKGALSIIQPKQIGKAADKEKPAQTELPKPPAPPKSAETPADAEAQAQPKPKQQEEGLNDSGRAKPSEDRPLEQKEESKMAAAPQKESSKEYPPPSVDAVEPAANDKTPVPAPEKETEEKMKGTVAEDDGAAVEKARRTSDDQKYGNGESFARVGGWTMTLMTMIASKPRMALNILLAVVAALLLWLYVTSSPMPANNNIKDD